MARTKTPIPKQDPDYIRAYSRGYASGSRKDWPEHRPPVPPQPVVGAVVAAAQSLRDEADRICAILSEDDDFSKALSPKIDALDKALISLTQWLKDIEVTA